MKRQIMAAATGAMACLAAGCSGREATEAASTAPLGDETDKLSYSIGVDIGRSLQRQGLPVRGVPLARGLREALEGAPLALTDADMQAALSAFQSEMMAKQAQAQQARQANGEERKKAGEAFLAKNAKQEGVVTLPSGLQYKIIKAGNGPMPTEADSVECHYRGTLIDGTEFDSSHRRGQPAVFPVTGVIAGWTEALKRMPVGSTWRLFIPANLAYGARGAGQDIGPHEALIFELELLGIR